VQPERNRAYKQSAGWRIWLKLFL